MAASNPESRHAKTTPTKNSSGPGVDPGELVDPLTELKSWCRELDRESPRHQAPRTPHQLGSTPESPGPRRSAS